MALPPPAPATPPILADAIHPGPPRGVSVAVVVLLATSAALWWAVRTTDPMRLGDRGTVTAEVDDPCVSLSIEVDGLRFVAKPSIADTSGADIPRSWSGRAVRGRLRVDDIVGDGRAVATFTSEGGTEVRVVGGNAPVFVPADCTTWT